MSGVGTLDWTRSTGGRLTVPDRARLLAQGIRFQLAVMWGPMRRALGLAERGLDGVDIEKLLQAPDSGAAREAEKIAREIGDERLVAHSYRTWAWGTLLARLDGRVCDDEVLFVGSLVHDVGLAGPRKLGDHNAPCFTLAGAAAAEELASEAGWEPSRAGRAAEAITLHMNLNVPPAQGLEAHYITAGAQLDVVGRRRFDLARNVTDGVLQRYPRRGTKQAFVELFLEQVRCAPGTRAHFYNARLGGLRGMRRAPFEE